MKHKTAELEGALLDAAVAMAEAYPLYYSGHSFGSYSEKCAVGRLMTGEKVDLYMQLGCPVEWIAKRLGMSERSVKRKHDVYKFYRESLCEELDYSALAPVLCAALWIAPGQLP